MISILTVAVLLFLVSSLVFPGLLRIGGALAMLDSVLSLTFGLGHGALIALMWLIFGLAAWLAGHLIDAYQHDGEFRTDLAYQAFRLPGLRAVAPYCD